MNKEEFLVNLTKEVLLPVMAILEKKVDVADIPKLVKKMHLNAITLLPFSNKVQNEIIDIFENKNNVEKIYNLGLSKEDLLLIFSYLYCRLNMFIENYHYDKEYFCKYNKLFNKICGILLNYQHKELKEEPKSDDFLEVYSNQSDELKKMHYEDSEKISAKEFMDKEGIDEDLIVDIKDLLDDFENIKYKYDTVSKEYIESIKELLGKFNAVFYLSGEFRDLTKGIERFIALLNETDIDFFDDSKKNFLKMFIDAFVDDLRKWYEEVIVYKSANDIHYLDASLMSSILQMENFLKES